MHTGTIVMVSAAALSLPAPEALVQAVRFEKTNRILLDLGPQGAFDACQAKYPCVQKVGDEWWMWYNGRADDCFTGAIGLATSSDGLKWTKALEGKPVLLPRSAGFLRQHEGRSSRCAAVWRAVSHVVHGGR